MFATQHKISQIANLEYVEPVTGCLEVNTFLGKIRRSQSA